MSRFFGFGLLIAVALAAAPAAWAEDPAAIEEVRALRAMIEKQSKQIDMLTEQVARLRIALEKAGEVPLATPTPPAAAAPPAAPSAETTEFSTESPKAQPADGKRHVVVKGETLTSIAKQYNLSLTDLKKANKNVDERKLQIGQTLTIPSPKTEEGPEKKEQNP